MQSRNLDQRGGLLLRGGPKQQVRYGWLAVAMLALLVTALGGSSRSDAVQIVALRPLTALLLVPFLIAFSRHRLADVKTPLLLLGSLTILMIVQLIPLPSGVFQSLPGRGAITDISAAIGAEPVWRPISMVPARTLNALASLIVPVMALLLAAGMGLPRTTLLLFAVAIGVADAFMALLQALSGWNEGLYFYAITNNGSAVGLFANQNHSAVFGSLILLVIGHLLSDARSRNWLRWQRAALLLGFALIFLSALIGGSRAGLLTAFLSVLATAAMFWLSRKRSEREEVRRPKLFGVEIGPYAMAIVGALIVVLIVIAFMLFDRIPAMRSLANVSHFDDLRWRLLPVLQEMMSTFWLVGSGFGSFEEVYHIFEPSELLAPAYVNQAHNDLAQLIIEGGVAACVLLGGTVVWFVRRLLQIGAATRQRLAALLFWSVVATTVVFASLVDYPLRTPLFQFVVIILIVAFCRENLADGDLPATN